MAKQKRVKTTKPVQAALPLSVRNSFEAGIIPATNNSIIQNGLGQAIGFPGCNSWMSNWVNGFPGGWGNNPWAPQIEQVNTTFENLRWYLVSNFRQPLSQAYAELGLVQTVIDVPVDDALRGGIEIQSQQLGEEEIQDLMISLDRDDDLNSVGQAAKWNRLFGGAGILVIVGDQDPEEPFDVASIKRNTSLEFRPVDMWELFWDQQNTQGYDPEIQQEEFDHYNYYASLIHKTRVMRMKNISAPSFIRPRLRGWGMSEVETLIRSMNQYLKATDLSFECLDEFKVDYYKIKNLVNTLMSPQGSQDVAQRIQMTNWQKNYQNAVVLDSEDSFEQKQLSFAGLAETMEGIRMQVAADLRMPITKLFGTSASKGLGNTDQNDMENYNSMIESRIRNKIKYDILRICEIKCQKLFGFIPEDLKIEFKPLRVLSAEQEENVKNQKFNRLLQLRQIGEIDSQTLKEALNKANLLPVQLDPEDESFNPTKVDAPQEESSKDPYKDVDVDDPGANRFDTRKVRTYDREDTFINSPGFDKASYEADGGDLWTDKIPDFQNPGKVDESLWAKAKEASEKAFGRVKWPFVTWWYKKQGGKFG